jgi:hypothetical protein
MTTPTTAEGRLYDAGFTRRLEYWVPPGSDDALSLNDAVARLDCGDVGARSTIVLTDTGVRALPDELVDRVCPPLVDGQPAPPAWLLAQAEVIAAATAKKLKPLIRAEVRAALRAEARKQARGPQA